MTDEKPTSSAGASISERLESFLSAGEPNEQPAKETGSEAAPDPAVTAEVPASDAQDETDGPQFELSDVAKVLGVEESLLDVDEDGSLKIKTKIDGKEGAAKLQDFIKSYQLQGHIDARVRQAAEQEKVIAERAQQIEQIAQTENQRLQMLGTALQQALHNDASQIDWDRLNAEDPIGYTTKRHEFERRQGQINQIMQAVVQQQQSFAQQNQYRAAQAFQAEAQRLPSLIPEWADSKVAETERKELASWLKAKGASPQTIANLADAGLVAALRMGMVAEKAAPKVAATEKLVRAAPKLVKPGQATTAQDRKQENVRGLKQQIRESGGKKGVAEYLIATGRV